MVLYLQTELYICTSMYKVEIVPSPIVWYGALKKKKKNEERKKGKKKKKIYIIAAKPRDNECAALFAYSFGCCKNSNG